MRFYSNHSLEINIHVSDEPTGRLALVFELMEMNLYDAIKGSFKTLLIFRQKKLFAREQIKILHVLISQVDRSYA